MGCVWYNMHIHCVTEHAVVKLAIEIPKVYKDGSRLLKWSKLFLKDDGSDSRDEEQFVFIMFVLRYPVFDCTCRVCQSTWDLPYTIMFTPARDFLLETPWRIIIPIQNVNSHSL
jgi:hypothetical protein